MNSMLEHINPRETLLLGERSIVKGALKDKEAALIHGKVNGEVKCKSLLIAKSGQVRGKIEVDHLELWGEVDGNLKVGKAYFLKGSVTRGVVLARSAGLVPGATLEGSLVFQVVEDEKKDET